MNIRMLKDMQGSNDGPTVQTFKKGEEYTIGKGISEDLARVFLGENYAEEVGEKKEDRIPPENKDAGATPENKDESGNDPDETNKDDAPLYPHTDFNEEALETMSMDRLRKIGNALGAKDNKKDELIEKILLKQKERRDAWEKENV